MSLRPARIGGSLVACASFLFAAGASAQTTGDVPADRPDALIDLTTLEGTRAVQGQWRYSDTRIVEVAHHAVGPDLKPSGAPTRAYDIEPHAGSASYDDRSWEILDPAHLDARRSRGRLAFSWYRIDVTIPEAVGPFDAAGSTAVFEVVVDDYAEVWVDGQLPVVLGQAGGQLVKGFNAPNRVVIARGARRGLEWSRSSGGSTRRRSRGWRRSAACFR